MKISRKQAIIIVVIIVALAIFFFPKPYAIYGGGSVNVVGGGYVCQCLGIKSDIGPPSGSNDKPATYFCFGMPYECAE